MASWEPEGVKCLAGPEEGVDGKIEYKMEERSSIPHLFTMEAGKLDFEQEI